MKSVIRERPEIGTIENSNKIWKCDANRHFSNAKEKKDKAVEREAHEKSKIDQERPNKTCIQTYNKQTKSSHLVFPLVTYFLLALTASRLANSRFLRSRLHLRPNNLSKRRLVSLPS